VAGDHAQRERRGVSIVALRVLAWRLPTDPPLQPVSLDAVPLD
jgi:hypothetical protein